jgi:Ca2+-binding RTX toxin-like protein
VQTILFQDLLPTRQIWVAAAAASDGDGSSARPFATIQAAVNAATPGTAILVKAGVYAENVKLPSTGGLVDAPIWLVSVDGPQQAQIAGGATKPGIQGLGTDNYVVKNFLITGTYDGIQFSQSGRDFTNLVNNVVIQGNVIRGVLHDGIKVGQADNAWILDNVIDGVRDEEGIDTLAVTNSVIARNEVAHTGGSSAGIFAKGGAYNVQITGNYVHDVVGDGISIGGNTKDQYFKPGYKGYEANQVFATDNRIEGADKQPLSIRGAIYSGASGNYLDATGGNGIGVYVTRGNPTAAVIAYSHDVAITGNVLFGAKTPLRIDAGNDVRITFADNGPGAWNKAVGPQPVTLWPAAPAPGAGGTLIGTPGNDTIIGDSGANTMAGGAGSDTYVANNTGDVVIEKPAEGTDTVKSSISYALPDNVENLVATGSATATLSGNALANSLTANGAGNVLRGMDGADVLVGGAGADTLEGGAGKENLIGGAGADRLVGGANQDNFVFKSLSEFASGGDVIVDLRTADYDRIDLRAIDASNQTSADQPFRFIGAAAFSHSEAELRFEVSGSDIVVSGDVNGDGVADFSLRVLNLSSISSNCFLL